MRYFIALDFFTKVLSPNTLRVTNLAPWRVRQGDRELQASLGYRERPGLKIAGPVIYRNLVSRIYSVLSRNEMQNLFSMGLPQSLTLSSHTTPLLIISAFDPSPKFLLNVSLCIQINLISLGT